MTASTSPLAMTAMCEIPGSAATLEERVIQPGATISRRSWRGCAD